jgi:hypothetical protein
MVLHVLKDVRSVLYGDIIRRNKQTPFIIFISFLLSFAAARAVVVYGPEWLRLFIREYHIHHFYYGFALLAVANWIALTTDRPHMERFAAVLFGVGLGLFIDEFGLLLTCTTPAKDCDYWARQSYDVFMFIAALFLAILYSGPFVAGVRRVWWFVTFRREVERVRVTVKGVGVKVERAVKRRMTRLRAKG